MVMAAGPHMEPIQVGPKTHHARTSLYQGRHYRKAHNDDRLCVRQRESKNDYRAVSRTGRYRGAYQFSPALAVGAAWMIQRELVEIGTDKTVARSIGRQLRTYDMNKWAPYWQDFAFWIVWDGGEGRKHWTATVPGTSCW